MRTHIPYKKWCPFCVKGKRVAEPHRVEKEKEKEEKKGTTIGIDYMWQKGETHREKKEGKIINEGGSMPTIVMSFAGEESDKWVAAFVVPAKGPEDYAIDAVGKEIEQSGLTKMNIKSDQEPALVDLIRAVKRERGESIEVMKPEHSPVGESQSNGRVERTIRTVQAQVRTLKLMVESKYKTVVDQESAILPWLVKYAATLINIASVGKDGRTPFERRSGRKWKKALPTFGECIWWMRPE